MESRAEIDVWSGESQGLRPPPRRHFQLIYRIVSAARVKFLSAIVYLWYWRSSDQVGQLTLPPPSWHRHWHGWLTWSRNTRHCDTSKNAGSISEIENKCITGHRQSSIYRSCCGLSPVALLHPVEIVNSVKISVDINRFFAKNVFRMPGIGKQTNNPLIVFEILWLICRTWRKKQNRQCLSPSSPYCQCSWLFNHVICKRQTSGNSTLKPFHLISTHKRWCEIIYIAGSNV